jgi:hypothetical protein
VYGLTKRLAEEVCRAAVAEFGLSVNILRLAWPTPDHLWPAWGQVTLPARSTGPGGAPACATAATDVAAALSYRDGLQAFIISADELAGRWSTAKARDLLAWHPNSRPPPISPLYAALTQLARRRLTPSRPSCPPAPPHAFFVTRANTTVPWTSPWLPPGYEQNFWNAAQSRVVQASPRRRETLVTR